MIKKYIIYILMFLINGILLYADTPLTTININVDRPSDTYQVQGIARGSTPLIRYNYFKTTSAGQLTPFKNVNEWNPTLYLSPDINSPTVLVVNASTIGDSYADFLIPANISAYFTNSSVASMVLSNSTQYLIYDGLFTYRNTMMGGQPIVVTNSVRDFFWEYWNFIGTAPYKHDIDGLWTAISNGIEYTAIATNELDPVWTSASNNYYTKSQSDGRYMQSYIESDPIWSGVSNSYYNKTQSDGRYLQSYSETDPIWAAVSNDYYSKTQSDGRYLQSYIRTFINISSNMTLTSNLVGDVLTYTLGSTGSGTGSGKDPAIGTNAFGVLAQPRNSLTWNAREVPSITTSPQNREVIYYDAATSNWVTGLPLVYPSINEGIAITIGTNSVIYDYSGSTNTFVVPAGITNLRVTLFGAAGRGSVSGSGGTTIGYITNAVGNTYSIIVGQGGVAGSTSTNRAFGGGGAPLASSVAGGGGASLIMLGTNLIACAGGGGGFGAGTSSSGGQGGGTAGVAGSGAGGGAAGTQSTGAALYYGGNTSTNNAGAGGGGYWGGMQGSSSGAGGGGSGYAGGLVYAATWAQILTADPAWTNGIGIGATSANGGNGRIRIEY